MHATRLLAIVIALVPLLPSCGREPKSGRAPVPEVTRMAVQLTSTAFAPGQAIPARHTCDGEDLSPPLQWSGIPDRAMSLALICDDPDAPAGTWAHWVLYGLPPATTELAEGVPASDTLPGGARQGINDFRRAGYGGPCPPRGSPHRYFFRLYALEAPLDLPPRASKQDLLRAMEGHVLGQGELMGTYRRQ
jgi:Raf kinase inhibitor-like YbhB/YbcL family protein